MKKNGCINVCCYKGDIILHEYKIQEHDIRIVAVSITETDGYYSKGEFGESSGYYTKCLYDVLRNSWNIDYTPQQVYIERVDLKEAKHIIDCLSNINENNAILHLIKKLIG